MKLKALATLGIASLVLSFSVAPATADGIAPVSVTTETIAASPDATLTFESPQVQTVPAPVPEATPVAAPVEVLPDPVPVVVAPVEPVQVVATPVATAPAPVAPVVTPTVVQAQPVQTTAPAVVQTVITENPLCVEQNLFTVTAEGACAPAPLGYTVADLRADALFELNSRNPMSTAAQSTLDAFAKTYLGSGPRPKSGEHLIWSVGISGVAHWFDTK